MWMDGEKEAYLTISRRIEVLKNLCRAQRIISPRRPNLNLNHLIPQIDLMRSRHHNCLCIKPTTCRWSPNIINIKICLRSQSLLYTPRITNRAKQQAYQTLLVRRDARQASNWGAQYRWKQVVQEGGVEGGVYYWDVIVVGVAEFDKRLDLDQGVEPAVTDAESDEVYFGAGYRAGGYCGVLASEVVCICRAEIYLGDLVIFFFYMPELASQLALHTSQRQERERKRQRKRKKLIKHTSTIRFRPHPKIPALVLRKLIIKYLYEFPNRYSSSIRVVEMLGITTGRKPAPKGWSMQSMLTLLFQLYTD